MGTTQIEVGEHGIRIGTSALGCLPLYQQASAISAVVWTMAGIPEASYLLLRRICDHQRTRVRARQVNLYSYYDAKKARMPHLG